MYKRQVINLIIIKSGCGLGLGELPEIWSFPFNISGTAESSDFKFGTLLGFAKARGASQNVGVFL